MEWQFAVALVIAIPIILFPPVFLLYVNTGFYMATKESRARRAARENKEKLISKLSD